MNGLDSRRADEHVKIAQSEASANNKANKGGTTTPAHQPAPERIGEGSTGSGEGSKDGVKTDTIEAKNEVEGEEGCIVLEQPLLTIKEVFVYRVPPLRASSGHRAEEWGLENPVFTGILKAAQVGDTCCLRLFKPPPEGELGASPVLFAECVVRLDKGRTLQVYVESVIDSSRYFVLRCEDRASGRHAYVGIGFRERSSAFDLKAVLDDFVRFIDRQNRAAEASVTEQHQGEEEDPGPVKQMKDLSIAEGQKVHLELKVGSNAGSRNRRRSRSDAAKSGGGGLLLPPPPLAGSTYKTGTTSRQEALTPTSPSGVTSASQSPDEDRSGKGYESVLNPAGSGIQREGEEAGMVVAGEGGEAVGDEGCQDIEGDDNWGEFESA